MSAAPHIASLSELVPDVTFQAWLCFSLQRNVWATRRVLESRVSSHFVYSNMNGDYTKVWKLDGNRDLDKEVMVLTLDSDSDNSDKEIWVLKRDFDGVTGKMYAESMKRESTLAERGWYEDGGCLQFEIIISCDATGTRNSKTTWWYPTGQKQSMHTRINGKLHGLSERWHSNGQLSEHGEMIHDRKVGKWTNYRSDGSKMQEETWQDDGQKVLVEYYTEENTLAKRVTLANGKITNEEYFT